MSTPEGRVKNKVKVLLAKYNVRPAKDAGVSLPDAAGWYFCPSQNGMGVNGIPDFVGHYRGRFWAIETKAKGKRPTGFQQLQIAAIRLSGGLCIVVDSDAALGLFESWLQENA